jgi:hypothetical protein
MLCRPGRNPLLTGTNSGVRAYNRFRPKVSDMPAWLEILIDMIGFAGFIGIAIYHKPKKNDELIR